ncbi:MAG: hypothetical protein DRI98_06705 [Bacteroidetes bacterium]|nr:MAG: hypothetical protein DRI98_06705 [Bacteroidota bacterium]
MKAKWINLISGSPVPLIMAAILMSVSLGCTKDDPEIYQDRPEPYTMSQESGNILNATFHIQPDGTNVELFGGILSLEFPSGMVSEPTLISVTSFPIDHLDMEGINVMNRGVSISYSANQDGFGAIAYIIFQYDLSEFKSNLKGAETNLTIYRVSENIYAYNRIAPIGPCCVNSDCEQVRGCISDGGLFVVGER